MKCSNDNADGFVPEVGIALFVSHFGSPKIESLLRVSGIANGQGGFPLHGNGFLKSDDDMVVVDVIILDGDGSFHGGDVEIDGVSTLKRTQSVSPEACVAPEK